MGFAFGSTILRLLTSQRFSKNGVTFAVKRNGAATIKRVGRTSVECQVK
jgi:hypothetical protein